MKKAPAAEKFLEQLINELDALSREPLRDKRLVRRYAYRTQATFCYDSPAGRPVVLPVAVRNISSGGVAFICSEEIAPETEGTLRLTSPSGATGTVPAKVIHQRKLASSAYECGGVFLINKRCSLDAAWQTVRHLMDTKPETHTAD